MVRLTWSAPALPTVRGVTGITSYRSTRSPARRAPDLRASPIPPRGRSCRAHAASPASSAR